MVKDMRLQTVLVRRGHFYGILKTWEESRKDFGTQRRPTPFSMATSGLFTFKVPAYKLPELDNRSRINRT